MEEVKDKLILLYAKYDVDFLDANGKLLAQALGKSSKDEFSFREELDIKKWQVPIRKVKQILEKKVSIEDQSHKDQVINCLRISYSLFDEIKLSNRYNPVVNRQKDILRPLIIAAYAHQWNERLRSHFNNVYDRLSSWNCFFFSFDREFRPYKDHKDLIKAISQSNEVSVNIKKLKKSNAFAIILVEYLLRNKVVGHHHLNPYDISPEMGESCAKSLTFVQLINQNIIRKLGDNICFEEYEIFMDHNGSALPFQQKKIVAEKCFFVSTDFLDEKNIPPAYANWYSDILAAEGDKNICTGNLKDFFSLALQIKHHILKARDLIIESIPEIDPNQQETPKDLDSNPKEHIEYLLSQDQFEAALKLMQNLVFEEENSDLFNDLIGLQGRLSNLEKRKRDNLLLENEYSVQRALIRDAIIGYKIELFEMSFG